MKHLITGLVCAVMAATCAMGQLVAPPDQKMAQETVWVPSEPGSLVYMVKPTMELPEMVTRVVSGPVLVLMEGEGLTTSVGTDTSEGTYFEERNISAPVEVYNGAITNNGNLPAFVIVGDAGNVENLYPGETIVVAPHTSVNDNGEISVYENDVENGQNLMMPRPWNAGPRPIRVYVRGCACVCGAGDDGTGGTTIFIPGGPQNSGCRMSGAGCVTPTGQLSTLSGCTEAYGPPLPSTSATPATP